MRFRVPGMSFFPKKRDLDVDEVGITSIENFRVSLYSEALLKARLACPCKHERAQALLIECWTLAKPLPCTGCDKEKAIESVLHLESLVDSIKELLDLPCLCGGKDYWFKEESDG